MDVGTTYACMYSLCCRTISKPTSYAETQWKDESTHVHRTRAKSIETTSQNHTMNKHGPIKDIG